MDGAGWEPTAMPLNFLREITVDFSKERKLGTGTYGEVYLGVHQDGQKIAVKRIFEMTGVDEEQFQNEFKNLARLQHRNIVRLVGYCRDIQQVPALYEGKLVLAEKIHRALCLEYMPNGSLDKYISDECEKYDWHTGYGIIKGICQGLKYLHTEIKPPIYHLDLKPANVLLDENMVPRIADFGISRLFGDERTRATKSNLGTQGYLPLEYIRYNLISNKFDIFSLGVIIIKIMAGRAGYYKTVDMSPQEFTNLVQNNWTNRLHGTSNLMKAHSEQVKICIEIGLECVEDDRHRRPSIQDIVNRLNETETECAYAARKDESLIYQDIDNRLNGTETECAYAARKDGSLIYQTESTVDPMTLQHLKDITNNFCNERILGRGGFGVVYKGVLRNGKMVAVKKLVLSLPSSQEQFENEVNFLMKLKHPNIVQLVGYCYETQHLRILHEGKFIFVWQTECLLCSECLPKGSLDKYISDASSGLDWPTRLKIMEGISYGLQYLHEQSDVPIIHLDLKPANILLDENMIAKITDFGLSRLFDQKETIHTATTTGTLGYMSQEYLQGMITPMSDIFSLGVIIMEVITGHKGYPYDIRTSSTEFIKLELQKWRNVLQKEPGYQAPTSRWRRRNLAKEIFTTFIASVFQLFDSAPL